MPFTYDPAAPVATTLQALVAYVIANLGNSPTPAPTPAPPPTDLDPGVPGATTLSFPSDRVSGANPVVLSTTTTNSAPGDLLQVRYGSSSSLDAVAWMDATISAGDEDSEQREFTINGTLPAGLTYFQARPKRVQDQGGNTIAPRYGSPSNIISDTLQAAGGTPTPTPAPVLTAWDPSTKSAQTVLAANNTKAAGTPGQGDLFVYSDTARGIGKKVSIKLEPGSQATHNTGFVFQVSAVPGATQALFYHFSGYSSVSNGAGPAFTAGDTIEFGLVANATTPANIDILARKNGGTAFRFVTNSSSPLFYGGYFNDETGLLAIVDQNNWN